jgi:FtsP/CotA-like multicopper oxidase with cupredoxin domain
MSTTTQMYTRRAPVGHRPRRSLLRRLGAVACSAALLVQFSSGAASAIANPIGIVCTSGPIFNLETDTGYVTTPDGNSVFMWGFKPAGGAFQMPGPVLCVNQGDVVTVNLANTLVDPVSIVFPGQSDVSSTGDSPGLFTNEANPGAGTASYTFTAAEPGTYLYESGTNPGKEVQMGLYGALIVRPTGAGFGPNYAYNDAATRFNPAKEFLILMNEIDPDLHQAVELNRPYDVSKFHAKYWHLNGRSFPDSISDNFALWLPNQPYGALVQIEPYNASTNPYPALIRYANAGMANHPFHPHGNHMRVVGRDGRLLQGAAGQDTSFEDFTRTVASGQTYDLLFKWTAVDAWIDPGGDPEPVQIPGLLNLAFKDGLTFYSGDAELGETGPLPQQVTSFNECGEYYFPWHSHALFEFTNFDEGFGGLATLLRVDPPGGCP